MAGIEAIMRVRVLALVLAAAVIAGCGSQAAEVPLPTLQLDQDRISVVGLSSGAAMAQQAHFAFSDHLVGAGLIAGPPYGCAEGDLNTALARCMTGQPDPVKLAERVQRLAGEGRIAPLSGLDGDRAWVMHGRADKTVGAEVARASWAVYEALQREVAQPPVQGMQLTWDGDRDIGHAWPTVDHGVACHETDSPYLAACDFDAAGTMLEALYGKPDAGAGEAQGEVITFDQNAHRPDGKDAFLADEGFLYVPQACAAGEPCGLVLAFHGCEQNAAKIGRQFVEENGLNRWADAHGLVIAYPQTRASFMPLNPKACWDWWGYSGADYDTRDGVQLRWLANLSAALGAPLQDQGAP